MKDKDLPTSRPEPSPPSTQMLKELAIYLEGIKQGKGNILPLGSHHIDVLWYAIDYLNKFK